MGHGEGGGGGTLRELLAVFGFGVDTHELEHGESKLDAFFEKVLHIGEGIAAAFAVDELFEFAEAQAHAMTAVEHMAARIGISTDEVQAWGYAARASGFEAEKFTTAMSRLQVATENKKGKETFAELGIHLKDASGKAKEADELFTDVAEAIKNTEDPNKRAAIATKLFGKSGRELIPILAEGKEGIDELLESYRELGGAYTEDDIERTKKFEKSQAGLSLVWTGLKATIARVLLPAFTTIMDFMTKLVKGFVELSKHSKIVQAALTVFGAAAAAFAVQLAIAAAPVLLIAAAIGGLILLVDEIITLFSGGDTLIGEAIDKMFGKGASVEVVKALKNAWEDIKNTFVAMWPYMKKVWDFFAWLIENGGKVVKALGAAGGAVGDYAAKQVNRSADIEYAINHPELRSSQELLAQPMDKTDALYAGFHAIGRWFGGGQSSPQSPAPGMGGDTHVNVNVKIGDTELKNVVHEVKKERNREHVDRLQRSGQP